MPWAPLDPLPPPLPPLDPLELVSAEPPGPWLIPNPVLGGLELQAEINTSAAAGQNFTEFIVFLVAFVLFGVLEEKERTVAATVSEFAGDLQATTLGSSFLRAAREDKEI